MTNYTKSTNFASKDSLAPGNPLKIVRGTEIDTEFSNILTAITSKADTTTLEAVDPVFLQTGTGAVTTTMQTKLRQVVSVLDFGADKTGTTTSSTAFTNANSTGNTLVIPKGTYLISSSVTFTVPVSIEYGAIITIPTGVTLAFNAGFKADVYKVFNCTGTGAVTFNWNYLTVGYPEWWGAKSDGATDCYAAITACLLACKTTHLHAGDYFTSSTIKMTNPYRTLEGVGQNYSDTASQVTRLLVTSASLNCLQVGPDTQPATVNLFQRENVVKNIYIGRTVAPTISSACCSVLIQYTLYAVFEHVRTDVSIYGFFLYGNVTITMNNCIAVRAIAGAGAGTDKWYGFYINGFASIGLAGGNASVYLNYCLATCNLAALSTSGSVGFYADNAFTDLFIESPESGDCTIGIQILGNASTTDLAGNTDCQIKNPIIDTFRQFGLYFKDINKFGSASVSQGYYAPATTTGTASVYIQNCVGSVNVTGGQFVMFPSTTCKPIIIDSSKGVIVANSQILESSTSGVVLTNTTNSTIRPLIKNFSATLAAAGVQLNSTCLANVIEPVIYGGTSKIALGVQLVSSANARNEINCTGIDSSALAVYTDKLQINGSPVSTTGLSGTNLVSGVMT